jgi:hypothetical protein
MGGPTRRQLLASSGALAALTLRHRRAEAQALGPLVVVVHPSCPFQNLSLDDLRAIFVGEPVTVPGAGRAMPINDAPNSPARTFFDRKVLRMEPDQVARFWLDRRIRGQSGAPRAVPQPVLRQQLVARFPQALSYVRPAELLRDLVRPLRIDGRQPGDRDYSLAAALFATLL